MPEALAKAEQHVLWLFHRGLKMPQHYFFPPGYLTERSQLSVGGRRHFSQYTFREFLDEGWALVGTPERVANQLGERLQELGCGLFLGLLHIGPMTPWETLRNLELFGQEVIPALRGRPAAAPA